MASPNCGAQHVVRNPTPTHTSSLPSHAGCTAVANAAPCAVQEEACFWWQASPVPNLYVVRSVALLRAKSAIGMKQER